MTQSDFAGDRIAASRHRAIAIVCALLAAASLHAAPPQPTTVTTATVSVPAELASPIAAALTPNAVTVTTGTTKIEFWWLKALPLRPGATGAPSWADVSDGALVGAMRLSANWSDIRGYTIRPGVYTLRFALQPQNGDHLGISPGREFLLPGPAAADLTVEPVGYDGAVALASKSSRRAHPASIAIDPAISTAAALSATANDLGHQVVIVSVQTSAGAPLTFGVVVAGTIDH